MVEKQTRTFLSKLLSFSFLSFWRNLMSRGETESKNSLIPSTATAPEASPVHFSSSRKRQ